MAAFSWHVENATQLIAWGDGDLNNLSGAWGRSTEI
jgi:hypothetical protein